MKTLFTSILIFTTLSAISQERKELLLDELNTLGYDLLLKDKVKEKDKVEDAIKIFALLVSEFPKSSNVYDSFGEAYFINKKYELALKNYKISLELNPNNTNAVEMIDKIENLIQ